MNARIFKCSSAYVHQWFVKLDKDIFTGMRECLVSNFLDVVCVCDGVQIFTHVKREILNDRDMRHVDVLEVQTTSKRFGPNSVDVFQL